MDFAIISIAAILASILTFFSGFGLGTILLPVFSIFFPLEVSIAMTAIVHLLNNLLKIGFTGKYIDWKITIKFGLFAILGAIIGAKILANLSIDYPITQYTLLGKTCTITPVKITIAALMLSFALFETVYKNLSFNTNKIHVGGFISGFFGGLSGHQGALRSAFLIKYNLSKECLIATGAVIATMIDISRISVYFVENTFHGLQNLDILLTAILSGFTGTIVGSVLLKKVTINFVQNTVAIMVSFFAILIAAGIL